MKKAITLIAALTVLSAAPGSAHASVSRSAAAKAALKALRTDKSTAAVRVFGTLKTVKAGTAIAESAPGQGKADKTDVHTAKAAQVLSTGKEPAWFFYADNGPHQGYAHDGRAVLVRHTAQGRALLAAALAEMWDIEARYTRVLGADRFRMVVEALAELERAERPDGPFGNRAAANA